MSAGADDLTAVYVVAAVVCTAWGLLCVWLLARMWPKSEPEAAPDPANEPVQHRLEVPPGRHPALGPDQNWNEEWREWRDLQRDIREGREP